MADSLPGSSQAYCCYIGGDGEFCHTPPVYWVGVNGVDDYTHVCATHLPAVMRDGDVVLPLVVA